MISQSRPDLQDGDFAYIRRILRTQYAASGPLLEQLESVFCRVVKTKYAASTSSGTSALHLGLLSLGVGPGDEVLLPSYTCAAVFQAIRYTGAQPRLLDIDEDTLNLTRGIVQPSLTRRTKAVIVTHTFGFPAALDELIALGVPLIEDCAHALGAAYRGHPAGSTGVLSVFSMYATKMICAGEGGMICTDDPRIIARVRALNGVDHRQDLHLRYNYKLSDLAAGLGLAQMRRLRALVARRRQIAACYTATLEGCAIRLQKTTPGTRPSYYRFVIRSPRAGRIIGAAREAGIWCDRPVFRPLHRYFPSDQRQGFPGTDRVFRSTVSIPIYPSLSNRAVASIARRMGEILGD